MKTETSLIPGFAPGTASALFDGSVKPALEQNHWRSACFGLIGLVLVLGLIILALLPLKSVKPVLVRETGGGELMSSGEVLGDWKPNAKHIKGAVSGWMRDLVAVDSPGAMERGQTRAGKMVTGEAQEQLREFRSRINPWQALEKNPNFVREYEFVSVNFLSKETVLLRFAMTSRNGGKPKTENFAARITYTLVELDSDQAIQENPSGLFVKSFNVAQEGS